MAKKTNAPSIDEALADALSDHMMATYGRRPTQSEMWDIYWAAVNTIDEVIEEAAKDG